MTSKQVGYGFIVSAATIFLYVVIVGARTPVNHWASIFVLMSPFIVPILGFIGACLLKNKALEWFFTIAALVVFFLFVIYVEDLMNLLALGSM